MASLCPHRRRQTRRAALCLHVHGDFHSEFIVSIAPVATGERNRLLGCPGDSHPDEVTVADDAVGGIEFDPAGAGDVDLAPSVSRASAQANRRDRVRKTYPVTKRAAKPNERAASIMSKAKSLNVGKIEFVAHAARPIGRANTSITRPSAPSFCRPVRSQPLELKRPPPATVCDRG